ncbi:hypothetical protein GGP41_002312 [Bipolaris sorokiniana]|uniref:Uncharacterized protein n=1 Tax=Cochliobolus sativus TaxID=45130 RepID=A0A8H5ZJQ3_COCSA|nr:hypothetical protein GGP41_002312 [Bipolaris sorokiniana]
MWSLDGCSDFIGSAGSFDGMSSEACAVSDGEGRLGEGDAMIQVRMDENSYKPDDFDRMSDDQSISDYRNNR